MKIIQTHMMMLSLFVFIYWSQLYPLESVCNLIEAGMVEDPDSIESVQVRFFLEYMRYILGSLILIPICLYALIRAYNIL